MSKHIKLDTAIEHTNQLYHGYEVEEWLNSLPTIDIVRCDDCSERDYCEFDYIKTVNGFCNFGERIEK